MDILGCLEIAIQKRMLNTSKLKPEFFGISSQAFSDILSERIFVDSANENKTDIYIHLSPDIFFIEDVPPSKNPIVNTSSSFGWSCSIHHSEYEEENKLEIVLDKNNSKYDSLFERYVVDIVLDAVQYFISNGDNVYDA